MGIFVYKKYCDEEAYGEQEIKLYEKKDDAVAQLKADVEEHYGIPFDKIMENTDIFDIKMDNISETDVSISGYSDVCHFWNIEEIEVISGKKETYVLGEKYWFRNALAGSNRQSCGTLMKVDEYGNYVMFNHRYGYITVTKDNLDEHN